MVNELDGKNSKKLKKSDTKITGENEEASWKNICFAVDLFHSCKIWTLKLQKR